MIAVQIHKKINPPKHTPYEKLQKQKKIATFTHDKVIMGKFQRNKGAVFERELATLLSQSLGQTITRNLGQTRDGGNDLNVPPFRIEAKRRASFAGYAFLEQVKTGKTERDIPLVIIRADRQDAIVLLDLKDFLPLMKQFLETMHAPLNETSKLA